MATNDSDRALKILLNKKVTSSSKAFYEEESANTVNVAPTDVWSSEIPSNPATAVTNGVAELKTLFTLTEDTSVEDSQSWYAFENGANLTDWLSDKHGEMYQIKLYDTNGVRIFPTDELNWFFDYQTGILTMNGDVSAYPTPFKITGYRYIGLKGIYPFNYENTPYEVTEFGAVADWDGYEDSSTDNKEAFQNAINACIAEGRDLKIPAGTYYLDGYESTYYADGSSTLRINGEIKIFGDGIGKSILKIGPNIQPEDRSLAHIYSLGGSKVIITDLEIEGPDTLQTAEDDGYGVILNPRFNTLFECNGATVLGGVEFTLERFKATQFKAGAYCRSTNSSPNGNTVVMNDCEFNLSGVNLLMQSDSGDFQHKLTANNTVFYCDDRVANSGLPFDPAIYISDGVSTLLKGCKFTSTQAQAIQFFTPSTRTEAEYRIVESCVFHDSYTAINCGQSGPTQISNCRFNIGELATRGISMSTSDNVVLVSGCTFNLLSGAGTVFNSPSVVLEGNPGTLYMSNCNLVGEPGSFTVMFNRTGNTSDINKHAWSISDCNFYSPNGQIKLYEDRSANSVETKFKGCNFNNGWAGFITDNSKLYFDNCTFNTSAVIEPRPDEGETAFLSINNCRFENENGGSIVLNELDGYIDIIGGGNTFESEYVYTREANVTGGLRPVSRTIAGPNTPLTAASTIWLSANGDTFHIDGTTTIDTINIGVASQPIVPALIFKGPFVLIAEDAWSISDAGNVKPKTLSARTPGLAYTFIYNPDNNFWYEL